MFDQWERQHLLDEEHLRLLAIGYWITAGLTLLVAIYGLIYVVMGLAMIFAPEPTLGPGYSQGPSTTVMGWLFAAIGFALMLLCVAVAVLQALAGFWIRRHRHRLASMVIAAVTCLGIPYGTLLGVCTFIVLSRASVASRYRPMDGRAIAPQPMAGVATVAQNVTPPQPPGNG